MILEMFYSKQIFNNTIFRAIRAYQETTEIFVLIIYYNKALLLVIILFNDKHYECYSNCILRLYKINLNKNNRDCTRLLFNIHKFLKII